MRVAVVLAAAAVVAGTGAAAAPVDASAAGTTVTITKQPSGSAAARYAGLQRTLLKYGKKKNKSTSLALANEEDEMWTANSTVNGIVYPMDLDTGSSDTWIKTDECVGDSSCTDGYPQIDASALEANSSYSNTGKSWLTLYGLGAIAGVVYEGPVTMGAYTSNVSFGAGYIALDMQGSSGLMGLAYESISNINGFDGFNASWFDNLGLATDQRQFAFYLSNSAQGDNGEVTFGGQDKTKYTGDIEWTPLSSETYWQFDISGWTWQVEVDGKTHSGAIGNETEVANDGMQTISDTGTTLIYISTAAAAGINDAVGGTWNATEQAYYVDCDLATSGPVVNFVNPKGVKFGIEPLTYVFANGDGTCSTGILPGGDELQIWGDVFTRNYYTIYDKGHARLGYAKAVHP